MLKFLFLEDNPIDVDLASYELRRTDIQFEGHRVETREEFIKHLSLGYDLILADFTLPQFNALEALAILNDAEINIPLIVVTGTISEEIAVECIKQGASDYLLKDRLARLPAAVQHALEEFKLREEKGQAEADLRASEVRYRTLVELAPEAIAVHIEGKLVFVNQATLGLMGAKSEDELLGKNFFSYLHPDFLEGAAELIQDSEDQEGFMEPLSERLFRLDGSLVDVEIVGGPIDYQGQTAVQIIVRDISASKRRERELRAVAAISDGLRLAVSVADTANVVLDQAMEVLEAQASLLLRAETDGTFVIEASRGIWENVQGMILFEDSLTAEVVKSGEPKILPIAEVMKHPSEYLTEELVAGLVELLCVPLSSEQDNLGVLWVGREYPFDQDDVDLLQALGRLAGSGLQRTALKEEIETNFVETVLALANTLDVRDTKTADHSQKMASWAELTFAEMGGAEEELRVVRLAALLHDIGKIGIPDEILRKNGPLTDEEFEIMKTHADIGAEIVAPISNLADVAPIIRAHQEKFDGTGYPQGLKGEGIPLVARVLTAVDAYSAMTEDRPYRKARPAKAAFEELEACVGTDFDPDVVEAFGRVLKELGEI